MQRISILLCTASMLFFSIVHAARAQSFTPADDASPWNKMRGSRLWHTYTSIIGADGTTRIPGSDTASSLGSNFLLTLPFQMKLFGASYAAGTTVAVGVGGYICFNSSATTSAGHYNLHPDPNYTQVVMPYWSDLQTTGKSGQGIYHSFTIDAATGDSIWTIEWKVETILSPSDSGRFQAQFVKHPAATSLSLPWTEVFFHYDGNTSLARTVPPGWGAAIGLKNSGQPTGVPPTVSAGSDDAYYLLMTPESTYPGSPTITRLPTRYTGTYGANTPDWEATAVSPYSSYFHYDMPDSSCKLKPVDIDANVAFCPPPGRYFDYVRRAGVSVPIDVTLINEGYEPMFDVPVTLRVYRGSVEVTNAVTMVDTLSPDDAVVARCVVGELTAGIYRIVATVNAANDANPANDTASRRLIVRPSTDIMAAALETPLLGQNATPRAQAGTPLTITGTVAGVGTTSPSKVFYSYSVKNAEGSVVAMGQDSTGLVPDTSATLSIPFGSWTPTSPGRYTISIAASAPGDQLAADDALTGMQDINLYSRHGIGTPLVFAPVPFEVFDASDLAAGIPGAHAFLPHPGDSVADSTWMIATFMNNGAESVPSVGAHLRITDPAANLVYDEMTMIQGLDGGGALATVTFPKFHPTSAGTYRATAWVDHAQADANTANDSVSWPFEVTVDTSDTPKRIAPGAGHLSCHVAPNPAADLATVTLGDEPSGYRRAIVTDLLGRRVRLYTWEQAPTVIEIDMRDLPAGAYAIRIDHGDGGRTLLPLVKRK